MHGRIRSIKPEFFVHEGLYDASKESGLGPILRLAYAGLWCQADREGRFQWRPRQLKIAILPYDECDFDLILNTLLKHGFVARYEVNGESFGEIPKFLTHQNINHREQPSNIPPPQNGQDDDASATRPPRVNHACPTREPRVSHASATRASRGPGMPGGNGTEQNRTERNGTRVADASTQNDFKKEPQNGHAPIRPRFPGSSREWDRTLEIAHTLNLDKRALESLTSSTLDDLALVKLVSDIRDDHRIKNHSAYLLTALKIATSPAKTIPDKIGT